MVELLNAANKARTALSGAITATATSFSVEDASSFPKPPFAITVEDEIMEVGTVSGNTFSNVTRGLEGTVAVAHEQGAPVENRFTAGTYNRMVDSFNEQKVKVIKVEQELNNFKTTLQQININQEAKQKVSGYDIITIPKNAANGQVSDIVLLGRTYTNGVINGDFSDSTNGWLNDIGSLAVADNIIIGTSNGVSRKRAIHTTTNIPVASNKKVYFKARFRTRSENATKLEFNVRGSITSGTIQSIIFNNPEKDRWYYINDIISLPSNMEGNIRIVFWMTHESAEQSEGQVLEIDGNYGVLAVDLTSLGETETDTDKLSQKYHFINGTKSTNSVRVKSVGKNLMPSFDKWTMHPNTRLINNNEIEIKFNDIFSSPFISIQQNKDYILKYSTTRGGVRARLIYYDENKNLIENTNGTLSDTFRIRHSLARYVRWNYYPSTDQPDYRCVKNMQLEEGTVATAYEPYRESTSYLSNVGELRSLPNGVKDEISIGAGGTVKTKRISDDIPVSNTVYDSIDTETYTNVDVIKTTVFGLAKAGTIGVDGQTRYYDKNGVELTEVAQADIDLEASVGKYYWHTDKTLWIIVAKGTYVDIAAARTGLGATSLNYQLAQPIITPVQVSGTLVSYPSGTVYIERVVPDAGLYTDKMTVLHKDLPIKALERLSKIDYTTGLETELNVSQAVISSDKLSFTHPSLAENDIVFFIYEYDRESTIPTTEIEYYDSRYVIEDKTTGKFYKWNIEVDNGVPNIVLTEV